MHITFCEEDLLLAVSSISSRALCLSSPGFPTSRAGGTVFQLPLHWTSLLCSFPVSLPPASVRVGFLPLCTEPTFSVGGLHCCPRAYLF